MHILAVYRYYWPDTAPYGRILRRLSETLVAEGHQVTVVSAQPSYNDIRQPRRPFKESVGGVTIYRLPLFPERKDRTAIRVLNWAVFEGLAFVASLLKRRLDLLWAHSLPPAAGGLSARIVGGFRRVPYLHHLQDIHPEIQEPFNTPLGRLSGQVARAIERSNNRGAAVTVVLSEDMAQTIRDRAGEQARIEVINNPLLESDVKEGAVPESLAKPEGAFRVLFAGNHGKFQGLDAVLECAHLLADNRRIHFQFVGEGVRKVSLAGQAKSLLGETVFFHPYVDSGAAMAVARSADLGLVPLRADVYRFAFPSKLTTLLAAGTPVLAMVEERSELSRIVRGNGLGWVVTPGDSKGLAQAISEAFERRFEWQEKRKEIELWSRTTFGEKQILPRWIELITGIHASRTRRSYGRSR